jgi:glycine/D-amino acid oxidase-like deaminating enzyme
MSGLERRVHGLHPVLRDVRLSHRWGGPILIADKCQPVFMRHSGSKNAIVLGAYSGHGVAQSVYLGAWAAEAMLENEICRSGMRKRIQRQSLNNRANSLGT